MSTYKYVELSHTEDIYASSLDEAKEAAKNLLREGEWGQEDSLKTIHVSATLLDPDGYAHSVSAAIEPSEPDCVDAYHEHEWEAPHHLVGGNEENPGVQGHGGGIVGATVCANCGCYRVVDTWDQSQGPAPVESIEYHKADEASRRWVEELAEDDE